MKYINPFSLFPVGTLKSYNERMLEHAKKRLMLKFQFAEGSTITINDRAYDKHTVLSLFDLMQADGELHWQIYQNKTLCEFLESGNLGFFNDEVAQLAVIEDGINRDKIDRVIGAHVDELISKSILVFHVDTLGLLKETRKYTSRMFVDLQNYVYQKTYGILKNHVDDLTSRFSDPFEEIASDDSESILFSLEKRPLKKGAKIEFHSDIGLYTSPIFVEYFDYLPTSFKSIQEQFATWCYNVVIIGVGRRQINYSRLKKRDVITAVNAAQIANRVINDEKTANMARRLKQMLSESSGRSSQNSGSKSGSPVYVFFIAILMIVKLVAVVSKCERNRSRNSTYQETDWNRQIREQLKAQRNAQAKERQSRYSDEQNHYPKEESNAQKSTREKAEIKSESTFFNGNDLRVTKIKLNETKLGKDYNEFIYQCEVLPTSLKIFESMNPHELTNSGSDDEKMYKMTFVDVDNNHARLSHFLNPIKYGKRTRREYVFRKIKNFDDHRLVTKKLPYAEYRYRGTITRTSIGNDKLIKKKFVLYYDKLSKSFVIDQNGATISIPFGQIAGSISEVLDQNDLKSNEIRFVALLRNMELALRKDLGYGKVYTLNKVCRYTFKRNDKLEIDKLGRTSGYLKYYHTSEADGMAYFNVKGKDYNIKYFYDTKINQLAGMQMVLFDEGAKEVERVELFRSK